MSVTGVTIGVAAQLLGVSAKTLRHYQRLGLLSDAHRQANGYRSFAAHDLLALGCDERNDASASLLRPAARLGRWGRPAVEDARATI